MNDTKFFYQKLIKNISSNQIFTKDKKIYKYRDIRKFLFSFKEKIKKLNIKKQQLKICTISQKSFYLYSSIISIFLSKNIWIPLDEKMPISILKYIIYKSEADIILVDNYTEKKIKKLFNKNYNKIININKLKLKKVFEIKNNFNEDDIAMMFFTSGSTGYPKGVKITNKNFTSSLRGQLKNIYSKKKLKNLVFGDYHNTSFIISLNILLPCVMLRSRISFSNNNKDKIYPVDHIIKNKVNCVVTLPSTINRIKVFHNSKNKIKIKALLLCGEPFYYDNLKFIKRNFQLDYIFNCYGSTELSPWVFSYLYKPNDLTEIKQNGLVPIGKNFNNVNFKVKNNELIINGPMINNYLNNEENKLNHKKINNKLWYFTNDKVKKRKSNLYVIGRSDSVIKIRGFRVELRGIEAKIREYEGITNCLVFKSNKKIPKIICAIETKNKNIDGLKHYLTMNLQHYMVPNTFIRYSKFTKNKNEKIDRKKIITKFIN